MSIGHMSSDLCAHWVQFFWENGMIFLEEIQKRLAEEIKHSGLSQLELASKVGIDRSQISSYLHGRKMPSLETFANLCKVLDADPAYILGLTD